MIYFKYLIKTFLSNISPNKSFLSTLYVNLKALILNFKYSIKNSYIKPSKIYEESKPNSVFWNNALFHLRFINYYYDRYNILRAPIIKIIAGGFLRDLSKININHYQKNNIIIEDISRKIVSDFNYLKYNSVYDWLDQYYESLINKDVSFESYKNIKNLSVLEIGPGMGFNALIYEKVLDKEIYFFDFEEVLDIQKKILINFNELTKKINFFSDIKLLKEKLRNKNYFITSYWAFTEFNLEDRNKFLEVIKNAQFSMFLSNNEFENLNNELFFYELSKKVNKNLLVIPFKKKNQRGFTKRHNYYILN